MKKLVQLTVLLLFAFCIQIQAQTESVTITEATTKEGKVVILKSDGTWAYKTETNFDNNLKQNNDGLATIYFYRLKETGVFNTAKSISIDNKEIFNMPQNSFLGVKLKAGKYKFTISNKNQSEMVLQTESGKTYFVLLNLIAGGFSVTYSLTETPKEIAVYQIRPLSVVEESKIKKSDLVFVKEKP